MTINLWLDEALSTLIGLDSISTADPLALRYYDK